MVLSQNDDCFFKKVYDKYGPKYVCISIFLKRLSNLIEYKIATNISFPVALVSIAFKKSLRSRICLEKNPTEK